MTIRDLIENSAFVHNEHKDWLSRLNFYQDEITFFQNELLIILHKHANRFSFVETVDEYKKIFRKKLEHIDDLRHQIVEHERRLVQNLGKEDDYLESHQKVREQFIQFVSEFEMLKKNFKRFAAHLK